MKCYRVNALLMKYLYISLNRFDRIFDLFYWPLLDFFIWGFMTMYIQKVSDLNLISFIFGGIILWIFVWRAAQDMVVYVLEDKWSRNVYNLFCSPMMLKELTISIILLGLIRSFIVFIFLSIIAFIIYKFTILTVGILILGFFVLILSIFAWAVGLFISGLIMRYGYRIQVLAWSVVWIIQPFSCVFYPLSALPAWAQPISRMLPTTYVFEGMRSVLSGETLPILITPLISSIVFFILAAIFFHRSVEKAKKKGLLAKNE